MLIPLFVRTNMTHFSTTPETGNMFFPNAETYVHAAIKRLGKYSQTCGYWNHSVQVVIDNNYYYDIMVNTLFFFFVSVS